MFKYFFSGFLRSALVLLAFSGLVACGGGGGGSGGNSSGSILVGTSTSSSVRPSSSSSNSSASSMILDLVCESPDGPIVSVTGSCNSSSRSVSSGSSSSAVIAGLIGGAIQGKPLNIENVVTTFAGTAPVRGADGVGADARFDKPNAIVSDGGNLYVADANNHTIRRIVIATGAVTTFAGTAGVQGSADGTGAAAYFSYPSGITSDGTNLYVSDTSNNTIRKIVIATSAVTTLAGTVNVSGHADGTATAASFNAPSGLATDGARLYVADTYNNTIRSIVIATGAVTTLVGTAGVSGSADGTGAAASFKNPEGVAVDGSSLYVADTGNHSIRKIVIASGTVTLLAGSATTPHGFGTDGGKDGVGVLATFFYPSAITLDGAKLYVADTDSNTIRSIDIATGAVSTLAGKALIFNIVNQGATTRGSADGVGAAARFSSPAGIATDGTHLYVSDTGNNTIRKIVITTNIVTTFSGKASVPIYSDGVGAAVNFYSPAGITTDGTNLYVKDRVGFRKIFIATGAVTEFTGIYLTVGDTHLTTDGTNLYVVDSGAHAIFQVALATGVATKFAGGHRNCFDCASPFSGSADGVGDAANFFYPTGITTDGTNLYVADTVNNTIRKIAIASGMVTTLAGTAGVVGSADGVAASFNNPKAITMDELNLYVADTLNHTIRRIVIATGEVITLAGTAGVSGSVDGTGAAARFYKPDGITTDSTSLYVSDTANNTIRKIAIATGTVTTLVGTAKIPGSADGTGAAARFDLPRGITTDGTALYVTDSYNNTIRKIH